MSVIYLLQMSPLASIDLPLDLDEQPSMSIYMVFQPIGRTADICCHNHGELLPRLFTLTINGGYSLLRYLDFTANFSLRSMVLYVARTFLLLKQATNHPTIICKSSLFLRIKKEPLLSGSLHEKEIFIILHYLQLL